MGRSTERPAAPRNQTGTMQDGVTDRMETRPDDSVVAGASVDDGSTARRLALLLWPYALILVVGLFILLPQISEFGFWDPWEPKYAESAREMLEKDSYVVPYYRDDVRLTKPILVYWGILAGSAIFGLNELGARFGGLCLALASMLGVFYAVSLLRGRQAGLIAALVLGTAPQFYFISRQVMPDVYLFTTLGSCMLFFALGLFGPDRRRNVHFVVSYTCFALAILAKGPMIAAAVGFGTLGVYFAGTLDLTPLWERGRRSETLRCALTWALGLPALAGLAFLSFIFGTSRKWWGYASDHRETMDRLRSQILGASMRFHLAQILLLALCLTLAGLAALSLYRWKRDGANRNTLLIGGVGTGVAAAGSLIFLLMPSVESRLLTGGLLGTILLIWLLPASIWRLIRSPGLWERIQPYLKPIALQVGLFVVVVLAVAGPWHVAIVVEQGEGFFTDFIIKHNINRAVEKVNSSGVTDFYIRTLIYGYFPWCAFIPIALASLVGWWEKNPFRRYNFEVFLLITTVVTFVAFSSSRTKFPHYLAPLLIPLTILIGLAIARTLERPRSAASRLTWITAAMLYMLPMLDLLRDGGVRYLVNSFTVKRWVPNSLETGGYSAALIVAVLAVMLGAALVRSRVVIGALFLVVTLLANYYTGTFIPELSNHKSLKNVTDSYRRYAMPDDPLGFHGDLKHGIFYYTSNEVELLSSRAEFMEFMHPKNKAFTVIERVRLHKLRSPYTQNYPGHELYLIDGSHFAYHLISNFPIQGLELDEDD